MKESFALHAACQLARFMFTPEMHELHFFRLIMITITSHVIDIDIHYDYFFLWSSRVR